MSPHLSQRRRVWAAVGVAVAVALLVVGPQSLGYAAEPLSTPVSPASTRAPSKRALIIAIGDYPAESGYSDLSSAADVPLVRGALNYQGFAEADIRVLADADATHDGITRAIREHLIDAAEPGDVLFLHYSGHGHRITDDDGGELDGYDEVLVPWDARTAPDPAEGDHHLRDDELGALVMELRRAAGPEGNVIVSLDACNSGSATRGLAVRGLADPIGPPGEHSGGSDEGSGLDEGSGAATRGATDEGLAPYIVFSAARHDQAAREVRDENGNSVGSLSFALSGALTAIGPGTTYRGLFDRIKSRLATLVPMQTPQMEGDADTEVFSGRVIAQSPYFEVRSTRGNTAVVLSGGTLLGLLPPSLPTYVRHGARKELE